MNPKIQTLCCLLLSLLICWSPVSATTGYQTPVDTTRIRDVVTALAAPELAGRRSGTEGNGAARELLLGWVEEIGLQEVSPGGYVQDFPVQGVEIGDLEITLESPSRESFQLQLSPATPYAERGECRLLYWGDGLPAPESSGDQLLVHHGPPGRGTPFFPSRLLAEAVSAGAWGLILIPHPADSVGLYNRYFSMAAKRDNRLYSVPGEGSGGLLAYAPPAAATALKNALDSDPGNVWGITLPSSRPLTHTGHNIIAAIPAAGKSSLGTLLLIAHYDHLGRSATGYFPGADDNASSVATLLETARMLIKGDHPFEIRFLFSDAEELGLLGARAYLAEFDQPRLVINLDSVGRSSVDGYRAIRNPAAYSPARLILWRSDETLPFGDQFMATCDRHEFQPVFKEGAMYSRGGDHAVFAQVSIPSLFVFGGFHGDYNTEQDLPDRILVSRLGNLARTVTQFVNRDLEPLLEQER